ncbi:MAG: hypothetical protein JWN46_711 [Acidimicrobiales bacterium]|nr:hypothetical protein [Acidimicrobiales bacterium]
MTSRTLLSAIGIAAVIGGPLLTAPAAHAGPADPAVTFTIPAINGLTSRYATRFPVATPAGDVAGMRRDQATFTYMQQITCSGTYSLWYPMYLDVVSVSGELGLMGDPMRFGFRPQDHVAETCTVALTDHPAHRAVSVAVAGFVDGQECPESDRTTQCAVPAPGQLKTVTLAGAFEARPTP